MHRFPAVEVVTEEEGTSDARLRDIECTSAVAYCDGVIKKFPVSRRVDLAQLPFDGFVGNVALKVTEGSSNVEQSEVSLAAIALGGEKCTGLQFSVGEQECAGKFVNDCFRANLSADNER